MANEPEFDAHGRGPLLRHFQDSAGVPPGLAPWQMRALCQEIVDAARRGEDARLPTEIAAMFRAAAKEELNAMIAAEVGRRLEPARKAFAELKAEVIALSKEVKARRSHDP